MEQHDNGHHDYDGITEDREQSAPVYCNVLFYGLIIWGIAFMAFYLLSGWSSDAEFQQNMAAHKEQHQAKESQVSKPEPVAEKPAEPQVAATDTETADGAAIYAQRCAMCHGGDAKGGVGPDLTSAEYVYGKTPEAVTESIAQGRKGMPGFGNQLSDAELVALVDYILSL